MYVIKCTLFGPRDARGTLRPLQQRGVACARWPRAPVVPRARRLLLLFFHHVAVGPQVPTGDQGLKPEQSGPDDITEPLVLDGYASVVLPEVHDMGGNCSDLLQPSEVHSFLLRGRQSAESSGIQPGGMPLAHFDAADVSASSQGPASPGTGAHGPPVAGCGGACAQGPSGGGVPGANALQADPFSRYAAYLRGRRAAALYRHFWLWRAAPYLGGANQFPQRSKGKR